MNHLTLLLASAPANESTSSYNAVSQTGPGFLGFVFTALMVIAAIFLIRDMIRRVRRVRYTSEAEAKQQEMVSKGEERKLQEPDEPHDPKTDEQQ